MDKNKVTFGLEQVHIAFKDTESTQPAWKTPIEIPGAVRFTPTAQGQSSTFWADNSPYYVVTSNNGYTGELEMALVPDIVLAEMLGWLIDKNGMLVELNDGVAKEFALMGQIQGDKKNRRFVYYQCVASRPNKENRTKAENIEPTTDVLNLTITPIEVDLNGEKKKITKGTMELNETNSTSYNAFFAAVTLPQVTETP